MKKKLNTIKLGIVLISLIILNYSCSSNKSTTSCYYSISKADTLYHSIKGTVEQKCIILEHSKYALNSDTLYKPTKKGKIDTIITKSKPSHKMARFILETGWGKDYKWVINNNPGGLFNGKKYLKFTNPYNAWAWMGHCQDRLGKNYSKRDSTKEINKIIKLYNLEALDNV